MNQDFDKDRLIKLVGQLCDQESGEEDLAELEATLKQHKQARELYHLTVALHRDLESCEIAGVQPLGCSASKPHAEETLTKDAHKRDTLKRGLQLSLAASVLVVASLIGYQAFRGENNTTQTTMIATVTDLIDVEWPEGQPEINLGDDVSARRLVIASGTILLTYKHGVVVTIEGPADFELQTKDHAILHEGQLVAYVPDGAEGFQVSTESADVVDLGTEFGVTARQDGSSDVIVFDGEVELAPKNAPQPTRQRVVAGLAYRVDRDGTTRQEEFSQSSFEKARSIIRKRQVIREPFRSDDLFPGEARNGWTDSWSLVTSNLAIDKEATGIHADKPLAAGTSNYLTVVGSSSNDGTGSLELRRGFDSFDQFDATLPYTVEFLFRLESESATLRQIRAYGVQIPADRQDDRAVWQIRAARPNRAEDLRWQVYHPRSDTSTFDSLPLVQGQTYRFLIEVHPQQRRWRASISDGKRSIWNTLRNGEPLRLRRDEQKDGNMLGWEMTVAPGSELRFSVDAIRIQNHPPSTLESRL